MSTLKTDVVLYVLRCMYCNRYVNMQIEMYSYKCGCCSAALAV